MRVTVRADVATISRRLVTALLVWLGVTALEASPAPFDPQRLSYSVSVRGIDTTYRVLALFVLPGEELSIRVEPGTPDRGPFVLATGPSAETPFIDRRIRWVAPAARGLHPIEIRPASAPGETMILNVFVLRRYTDVVGGMLGTYRIGNYPKHPLRGLSIYEPPRGFVEVTRDLVDVPVSPHFTLGQFLCKQAGDFPKYLVLRERLLLKLELLLEHANASGYRCDGFTIMSGYRTPYYNSAIGNVAYSRHLWGGAADIFIDVDPADGVMDDLDGSGKVDERDAAVLRDLVEKLTKRPFYTPFVGGLARYRANAAHGPFVHVDVRGTRARWDK